MKQNLIEAKFSFNEVRHTIKIALFESSMELQLKFPRELYGSCYGRIMKENRHKVSVPKPKPVMRDFNLPESQSEWDSMIKKLGECGFDQLKAVSIIKERKCFYKCLVYVSYFKKM